MRRRAEEREALPRAPADLWCGPFDALWRHDAAFDELDDPFDELWHDAFFAPLLGRAPMGGPMRGFNLRHQPRMMEPAFRMREDGEAVSLALSLPGVPPEDIAIEVIGGRVVHITGEKRGTFSTVTFDKRFGLGDKLNESNLRAALSKEGELVVTAPKVGTGVQEERRRISILKEL